MNNLTENNLTFTKNSNVKKTSDKKISTRQKVNVLWTGGFDSTYRMIQLSKSKVDIQPYYISDKRKSEELELTAISAITNDINNHPDTQCTILPLIEFNTSDIEPDMAITEAYKRLNRKFKLGIQYDWLARFAKVVPGIELCIERAPTNKAYKSINKIGKTIKISDKAISYYCIDENNSEPDINKVFKNFHFPYPLFTLSKQQMVEEYKRLGFENTMAKTWFCHSPFKAQPCGVCNPCLSVIEEGLAFRIPPKGLKRYKFYQKYGSARWYNLSFKTQRFIANYI